MTHTVDGDKCGWLSILNLLLERSSVYTWMSTVCSRYAWKLVLDTISTWANVGLPALRSCTSNASQIHYSITFSKRQSPNPENLSWLSVKMKKKKKTLFINTKQYICDAANPAGWSFAENLHSFFSSRFISSRHFINRVASAHTCGSKKKRFPCLI